MVSPTISSCTLILQHTSCSFLSEAPLTLLCALFSSTSVTLLEDVQAFILRYQVLGVPEGYIGTPYPRGTPFQSRCKPSHSFFSFKEDGSLKALLKTGWIYSEYKIAKGDAWGHFLKKQFEFWAVLFDGAVLPSSGIFLAHFPCRHF